MSTIQTQKTSTKTTPEKIVKLAESIFALGKKSGKDEAKSLAKSKTAKSMSRFVESAATKTDQLKNTMDDKKLRRIASRLAMSEHKELTYGEVSGLVNASLLRLALMKKPEKAKETQKKDSD